MTPEPYSFGWVIDDQVAAMGRPASLRSDLEFLRDQQIQLIVSLTETPLAKAFVEEFGFDYAHIPVPDFTAPTQQQIDDLVAAVSAAIDAGERVVIHCHAGKGRTGTMLACLLVHRGRTTREAIREVRRLRPGSIETPSQEEAIQQYEVRLREKKT